MSSTLSRKRSLSLSVGAKAGIGIGVAVACSIILMVVILLILHIQQRRRDSTAAAARKTRLSSITHHMIAINSEQDHTLQRNSTLYEDTAIHPPELHGLGVYFPDLEQGLKDGTHETSLFPKRQMSIRDKIMGALYRDVRVQCGTLIKTPKPVYLTQARRKRTRGEADEKSEFVLDEDFVRRALVRRRDTVYTFTSRSASRLMMYT